MTNKAKAIVEFQGNDEYRITWPEPFKLDTKFFLLARSEEMKVVSPDESGEMVIGVEGKKQSLLSWLREIEVIDEDNLKSFEEAMTQ